MGSGYDGSTTYQYGSSNEAGRYLDWAHGPAPDFGGFTRAELGNNTHWASRHAVLAPHPYAHTVLIKAIVASKIVEAVCNRIMLEAKHSLDRHDPFARHILRNQLGGSLPSPDFASALSEDIFVYYVCFQRQTALICLGVHF